MQMKCAALRMCETVEFLFNLRYARPAVLSEWLSTLHRPKTLSSSGDTGPQNNLRKSAFACYRCHLTYVCHTLHILQVLPFAQY
jgi:hypothetical protein